MKLMQKLGSRFLGELVAVYTICRRPLQLDTQQQFVAAASLERGTTLPGHAQCELLRPVAPAARQGA